MARPKIPLDAEQIRNLAQKHWSIESIAAHFGVSRDTIHRRYAAIIEEGRHQGKAKLIDVLWHRGVVEKSDRILENLSDRVMGPVPKEVKITEEPTFESKEEAIQKLRAMADSLEKELENE